MTVDLKPVGELCQQHLRSRSSLVMLLQDVQSRYGYLPREVLKEISREMDMPLSRIYGLATFYRSFSLTPRGRHEVCVCTGTACHVRGATTLMEHLERKLGVAGGQTTPDGQFTLVGVNCLGACALGPVLVLDGKYHGKMTIEKVNNVLAAIPAASGEGTK
jgi:NADH-quinone oxidoreductase subunit E